MKLACNCGHVFTDQTDYLPYAAHLLADQDFPDAAAMSRAGSDNWHHLLTRKIYQCNSCGRLWIEDHERTWKSFVPEAPASHILSSIHGKHWKRILRGEWIDKHVVSGLPEGFLNWAHLSDVERAVYDDWNLLEQAYHERFEDLKHQGILRDALLMKNGEPVHSWSCD
jgi:hypothetical protein